SAWTPADQTGGRDAARGVASDEARGGRPASRATRLRACGTESERDHALEHEPAELPAVADVVGREVEVPLARVLALQQDRGGHEPAGAELPAVHRHVVGLARDRQLTIDAVVPRADVHLLALEEPVHHVRGVLIES